MGHRVRAELARVPASLAMPSMAPVNTVFPLLRGCRL